MDARRPPPGADGSPVRGFVQEAVGIWGIIAREWESEVYSSRIRGASWAFEIEKFKKIREKYLLYGDFESRIDLK